MNILCLVKQVPDTLEVRLSSDLTLQRDFVAQVLNPADESAVELGLQLRDEHGGRVTVMTMGPKRAEAMLRELMARGADEAVLLTSPAFAGADTLATARALAAAAKALGPFDLMLFGRRAADGETGQVGPMTAALLDIPCVPQVIRAEVSGDMLTADQLTEDGAVTWACALPAALTLCEWQYPLRLPSLRGLKRAREAAVRCLSPEHLGLDPAHLGLKGSPTRVIRVDARAAGNRSTRWITAEEALEVVPW